MNRIILKKGLQKKFLIDIKVASGLNDKDLADICHVHRRTIGDWRRGKTTMPFDAAELISNKFNVGLPVHQIQSSIERLSLAGKKGGQARFKKYGTLGDDKSRRNGGLRSQITHKLLGTDFKQRKSIKKVDKSDELAEFIGIMLGDGGIANYHISISLNSSTDLKYSDYVIRLSEKLFGLKSRRYFREKTCLNVCIAGVSLVEYLIGQGLSHNKVVDQVGVPLWITDKINYRKACLRGLIDTDGSVYVDRHKGIKNNYASVCLDFSNRSLPLLDFVYDTLVLFALHPRKYKYSIKLRKAADVVKYFEKIGSSNQKHKNRYKVFIKKYGEVA